MDGILNTTTHTIHKYEPQDSDCATACGATRYVGQDQLHRVGVEKALADQHTSKCGRCFADGRGY